MPTFETAFGIPDGHVLRKVTLDDDGGAGDGSGPWEHEEYDADGRLVAVYESWPDENGGVGFTKYSPHGWVLSISGRSPRHPPERRRAERLDAVGP
jgi:hypothetical protein